MSSIKIKGKDGISVWEGEITGNDFYTLVGFTKKKLGATWVSGAWITSLSQQEIVRVIRGTGDGDVCKLIITMRKEVN